MLEVELDIFSGMPNPKWILSESEEKELLDIITSERTQISPMYAPNEVIGLGYGGFIVREIKTDEGIWNRTNRALEISIPREFRVGSKPAKQAPATEWLLKTSEKIGNEVTDELRKAVAKDVKLVPSSNEVVDLDTYTNSESIEDLTRRWSVCPWNYLDKNAYAFNRPENIGVNNCYCFAANHLAGIRYARPGRRGGP